MNKVILVGNPNVGKTTLFNNIARCSEKANNWHGVTVDVKEKELKIKDEKFIISDLPGLYSLDNKNGEEKIASDYLAKNKEGLIINICDANNINRNLKLTKDLIKKYNNVILVVNMINEVKRLNLEELSNQLGIKIIGVDARKNKYSKIVKNAIYDYFYSKNSDFSVKIDKFNKNIEKIDTIINNLNKDYLDDITIKIDKIILNKFVFLPVFLCVILLIFYLTFGRFGEWFSNLFNNLFLYIYNFLHNFINGLNVSKIIKEFLINGLLNPIQSIISFMPQIILLMTFLDVLEDTGFMSRIAFMFDGILKKIGLSGRSIFSIMMGYGCMSSAMLTTRNIENNSVKKRTALILPFSVCSAKLPVFLVITSLFFEKYKVITVFLIYIISVLLILFFSFIYKKLIPGKTDYFLLELPKYRIPYIRKVLKNSIRVSIEFIYKVGTTILFSSAIFWLLQNFSISLEYLAGDTFTKSILYFISDKLKIIFKPIGLDNAGIVAVLIIGLIAKELVIVGLAMVNGVGVGTITLSESLVLSTSTCYFTRKTSLMFMLFILIYSPCVSALSTVKNELGVKTSIYVFISQFVLAYSICYFANVFISKFNFLLIIVILILAIMLNFMIKLKRKNKCKGNCNACRKI